MIVHGDITNRNDKFHYELHREIYNMTSHLHYFVEICVLLEGEMEITVNGRSEVAKSGQCIFILPFQEHSYRSERENVFAIYAFSSSFIASFMKKTEGTIGERAVFDLSESQPERGHDRASQRLRPPWTVERSDSRKLPCRLFLRHAERLRH